MPHLENNRWGKVWQVGRDGTLKPCHTTPSPRRGVGGVAGGAWGRICLMVGWGK